MPTLFGAQMPTGAETKQKRRIRKPVILLLDTSTAILRNFQHNLSQ